MCIRDRLVVVDSFGGDERGNLLFVVLGEDVADERTHACDEVEVFCQDEIACGSCDELFRPRIGAHDRRSRATHARLGDLSGEMEHRERVEESVHRGVVGVTVRRYEAVEDRRAVSDMPFESPDLVLSLIHI